MAGGDTEDLLRRPVGRCRGGVAGGSVVYHTGLSRETELIRHTNSREARYEELAPVITEAQGCHDLAAPRGRSGGSRPV